MKLILTFFLLAAMSLTAAAQQIVIKADAYYSYDVAQSAFYLFDTTNYYFSPQRLASLTGVSAGYGDNADYYKKWGLNTATNQYEEAERGLNSFDGNGHLIQGLTLNVNNGLTDTNSCSAYTYNSQGLETSGTYDHWSFGNRLHVSKDLYNYDGQGNLIESIHQKWYVSANAWVNDSRVTANYSGSILLSRTYYDWVNNAWTLSNRDLYLYNAALLVSDTSQYFNGNTSQWENSSLKLNHYSSTNDIDTISFLSWATNLTWQPSSRALITTDNNHNWLSDIFQSYQNGFYKNVQRNRYTYNAASLATSSISDVWDDATGQFKFDQNSVKANWYYGTAAASVSNGPTGHEATLQLYPNPAATTLHIKLNTTAASGLIRLSVCDLSGKALKVWSEPGALHLTSTVNVSDLPSGNYLLRCNGGQFAQQQFSIIR